MTEDNTALDDLVGLEKPRGKFHLGEVETYDGKYTLFFGMREMLEFQREYGIPANEAFAKMVDTQDPLLTIGFTYYCLRKYHEDEIRTDSDAIDFIDKYGPIKTTYAATTLAFVPQFKEGALREHLKEKAVEAEAEKKKKARKKQE